MKRFIAILFILQASLLVLFRPTSPQVRLALLGDVMVGRGVALAHRDGNWEQALAYLAPRLQQADLTLANLESPINPWLQDSPSDPRSYNLCAGAEGLQALITAGVDLLSLANNHSLDCASAGPTVTKQMLNSAGLEGISPGISPLLKEINGLKLAFFSLDDVSSLLDLDAITLAVSSASSSGRLVIVSFHWGSEYQGGPSQRQQSIAQTLVNAGASLVWGHHPHVLQRLEQIQVKCDSVSRETTIQDEPFSTGTSQPISGSGQLCTPPTQAPSLVAYSLGNALFDQPVPPDATQSALLMVDLDSRGVRDIQAIPFEIDGIRGKVIPPNDVTAEKILGRLGSSLNFTRLP